MANETFRHYKDDIYVSDYGYVRKGGIELPWHKDDYYYYVCLNGKAHRIHNLVGETFPDICGEHKKYYHLHHKNRNQLDNRAVNLIWLSPSEHKRLHQKEDGVSVGVKAYDKQWNLVGIWASQSQAANETGVDYRHISQVINRKSSRYTAGGYYWFRDSVTDIQAKERILELEFIKHQGYTNKNKKSCLI